VTRKARREARLSAWLRVPGKRPLVLGHRGARQSAPENSLRAFELALGEGADGFELDVRLDRDGRVIVLHDAELGRVSAGSEARAAEDLGPDELGRVDLGGGERVPLLVDVLRLCRERHARVNVELKRYVRHPVALLRGVERAVRESGAPPELVIFSSFRPGFVAALARRLPTFPRAWLVHEKQRILRSAPLYRLLGSDGVHPQHSLVTARSLARWKSGTAVVNTWTVNDGAEARRLADLGVDAIISDRPGAMLEALATTARTTP
jgi:glycerophosphoryl diester phosphodiesterase